MLRYHPYLSLVDGILGLKLPFIIHTTRIHLYEGLYKAEKGQGMAVERTIELVTHKMVIKENWQCLISVLTSLEANEVLLACTMYSHLEDLRSYLKSGLSKSSFGVETDRLLAKYPAEQKRNHQIISECYQAVPSETGAALGCASSLPVQSNLDYPNLFGQGKALNCLDKQGVRITLTTPKPHLRNRSCV